jgi:hypothetical protein
MASVTCAVLAAVLAEAAAAPDEAEILEDWGRIRMPRRNVTPVTFHFIDVGRQPMRVYADDDCEIWDDRE